MTIQNMDEASSVVHAPTERRRWSRFSITYEKTSSTGATFATVVDDKDILAPPCRPIRQESGMLNHKVPGPPSIPRRQSSRSSSSCFENKIIGQATYGVPCSPSKLTSLKDEYDDDDSESDDDVRKCLQNLSIRKEVGAPPRPRSSDRFSAIAPTFRKSSSNDSLKVKSILRKKTRHSNPAVNRAKSKKHSSLDDLRHTVH